MAVELLSPQVEHVSQEYVLVQAWRKASAYIRYHNWYSDILELDRVATDLPNFIQALSEELKSPETWKADPLPVAMR